MSGPLAWVHLAAGALSLALGARIFTMPRGTVMHKQIGYGYVLSMLILNASSLLLYARTGSFGPFHIAALISLATLVAGFVPVFTRWPKDGWLSLHWEFMSWSFVGLVAAAVAEVAFRIPGAAYWPAIIAGSLAIFVAGGTLIYRSRGAMRQFVTRRTGASR